MSLEQKTLLGLYAVEGFAEGSHYWSLTEIPLRQTWPILREIESETELRLMHLCIFISMVHVYMHYDLSSHYEWHSCITYISMQLFASTPYFPPTASGALLAS